MKKMNKKMIPVFMVLMIGHTLGTALFTAQGSTAYASPNGPGATIDADAAVPITAAENIRVLVMNTDFKSIFHPYVTLRAAAPMTMVCAGSEEVIGAGQEITILADDPRLLAGKILFRPSSARDEISVQSVTRAMGTPAYAGTLEVKKEAEGLTLINELNLENYLAKVVPSEMPSYYEPEALKAQAVCARSYAHNRIQTKVYDRYGAHVDDSVEFQVYNNVNADSRAYAAVMETAGKYLTYNGAPVEGYFFSTSCGYTTDSTIWKNLGNTVTGYMKGIPAMEGALAMDLTNHELFSAFIKDKTYASYDSFAPFYRWETTVSAAQLAKKIPEVGIIQEIQVVERGVGGIAKALRLKGTIAEKTVRGQEEIRAILGSAEHVIMRQDGTSITGWETLPSAYITIDLESYDGVNGPSFRIYGGGYGHGVGMSQNGAQGMAKAGRNYEEILKFYFNEVEVKGLP